MAFPIFQNCVLQKSLTLACIWRDKILGYLSAAIIFSSGLGFPRATFSENCSLLGTDNVRGQIAEHTCIFMPNGGYCLLNTGIFCSYQSWPLTFCTFLFFKGKRETHGWNSEEGALAEKATRSTISFKIKNQGKLIVTTGTKSGTEWDRFPLSFWSMSH